jgi:hypothetical protein
MGTRQTFRILEQYNHFIPGMNIYGAKPEIAATKYYKEQAWLQFIRQDYNEQIKKK